MIYQEILPDPRLKQYIDCYWLVKSEPGDVIDFRMIFPDGCTDIIFNFSDPLISRSSTEVHVNSLRSFIVGNMTRTILSSTLHVYDLLGVRFKAGGMQSWLQIPVSEFTDEIADAETYPVFRFWWEKLCACNLINDRIAFLNHYLLDSIVAPLSGSIQFALTRIRTSNGVCRISNLSRDAGISQKQLERNFKYHVGLTPKQFARVIQFQHMTSLLRAKGEDSLLQLAIDGGYTDHAHFTKSFREFSGITPREFLMNH